MIANNNCLIWEGRQAEGNGTGIVFESEELVGELIKLRPRIDLDEMVSQGTAVRRGRIYMLTEEGYAEFEALAEQKGDTEIIEALRKGRSLYWFRKQG